MDNESKKITKRDAVAFGAGALTVGLICVVTKFGGKFCNWVATPFRNKKNKKNNEPEKPAQAAPQKPADQKPEAPKPEAQPAQEAAK